MFGLYFLLMVCFGNLESFLKSSRELTKKETAVQIEVRCLLKFYPKRFATVTNFIKIFISAGLTAGTDQMVA